MWWPWSRRDEVGRLRAENLTLRGANVALARENSKLRLANRLMVLRLRAAEKDKSPL